MLEVLSPLVLVEEERLYFMTKPLSSERSLGGRHAFFFSYSERKRDSSATVVSCSPAARRFDICVLMLLISAGVSLAARA